jgi:hypothetical protein
MEMMRPPPQDVWYQAGAACATVALASLFDVWATWVALTLGVPEANPLLAPALNAPGWEVSVTRVVGLKAVGIVALAYGAWRVLLSGRSPRPILAVLRALAYAHLALALYHAAGIARAISIR